MNNYCD